MPSTISCIASKPKSYNGNKPPCFPLFQTDVFTVKEFSVSEILILRAKFKKQAKTVSHAQKIKP